MNWGAILGAICGAVLAFPAMASEVVDPALDDAIIEGAAPDFSLTYGQVSSDATREHGLFVSGGWNVRDGLRIGTTAEMVRNANSALKVETIALEASLSAARIGGWHVGVYSQYALVDDEADAAELKLLVQRRSEFIDAKFNLAFARDLADGAPLTTAYAASIEQRVRGPIWLGVTAYGDLGRLAGPAVPTAHYAGPTLRADLPAAGADLSLGLGVMLPLRRSEPDDGPQVLVSLGLAL